MNRYLLILADDLGYGDVSCFNPEGRIHTPYIYYLVVSPNGMKLIFISLQ